MSPVSCSIAIAALLSAGWGSRTAGQSGGTDASAAVSASSARQPAYAFHIERGWLRMSDGVRLAVTYWRPAPHRPDERFPVVLSYLPYRKEDSSYPGNYALFTWFARRGFIMAAVDIRGTGSSEGHLPPREYSDEEMQDADSVIAQLARLSGSNGAVGMWGISWGGFNSIQIAMRRPPALKAIIAVDATDDLYHDDIHYIDGVLHVDEYMLEIDHENGLPAPPDYRVDSAYDTNRFDARPWLLTYLEHSTDSDWWRRKSLRFHYDAITIPSFLIGGLLDGYRDAVPRMLDSVRAPVKAEIGPWQHDWPTGSPGPAREWRGDALRWWDHWLNGRGNGVMDAPRLILFERAGHAPDAALPTTPGVWRYEDWPIARTTWRHWFPGAGHRLGDRPDSSHTEDRLTYDAGAGTAVPVWWGDPTGNMAADDGSSLVYDTPPLAEAVQIAGFPSVRLRAAAPASVADWTVRLEDMGPGGRVSLVTGSLISGAQRISRLAPRPLPLDTLVTLTADLHFTTWTFQPGHRIRLAVSNAQFPMAWPTPAAMTTRLLTEDSATVLVLPVTPPDPSPRVPPTAPLEARESAPDARSLLRGRYPGAVVTHDALANTTAVDFVNHYAHRIGHRVIDVIEKEHYDTHDDRPADSRFLGDEVHRIRFPTGRVLRLHTTVDMHSDSTTFHVVFTRQLFENTRLVRTKTWDTVLARGTN